MLKLIDQKRIEDTVGIVEKTTSGEIKVVVVDESSTYRSAHLRSGLLLALFAVFFKIPDYHQMGILFIQLPLFIFGHLICYYGPIKTFFLLQHEIDLEVHQRSMQAFLENNLHNTIDRTGILIFASVMEQKVIILADSGINEKVEIGTWQKTIDELIEDIKKKNLTSGLLAAIFKCGDLLSKHFPPKDNNPNELSDKPEFSKK